MPVRLWRRVLEQPNNHLLQESHGHYRTGITAARGWDVKQRFVSQCVEHLRPQFFHRLGVSTIKRGKHR
jgi:hypothetical protein